jgi:hypothetical protein
VQAGYGGNRVALLAATVLSIFVFTAMISEASPTTVLCIRLGLAPQAAENGWNAKPVSCTLHVFMSSETMFRMAGTTVHHDGIGVRNRR